MNNVCEEEPISMFWAPDGLNELKEQRFEFPFILIGKSTMELLIGQSWRVVKPWYTGGGPEHEDFIAVSHQAKFVFVCQDHWVEN